jgi:uncharacterized protein
MKPTLDARQDVNLIRGYASGEVRIGEALLHSPCIVAADRLITNWPVTQLDAMSVAELAPIFELQPDVVLLGTGARQTLPPSAVREAFAARKVGLEVMDLGAACRTYNILVQEERRVVAVLFLR